MSYGNLTRAIAIDTIIRIETMVMRGDGTWEADRIPPHPFVSPHPSIERETSQPNFVAVEQWADGLEPVYLEGALARAQGRMFFPGLFAAGIGIFFGYYPSRKASQLNPIEAPRYE